MLRADVARGVPAVGYAMRAVLPVGDAVRALGAGAAGMGSVPGRFGDGADHQPYKQGRCK